MGFFKNMDVCLEEISKMDMDYAGCGQLHHGFDATFIASNAYLGYAAECEGDNFTREGKINKVIKLLAASDNPNDFATQCAIYDAVGIDSDTFTEQEVEYIQKEVARCL